MRVVIVSKALIVGAYQRKAEEIARHGVDLTVIVPPGWSDRRGQQAVEFVHTAGYDLRVLPLWLNGNYHLHLYPTLGRALRQIQPDLVHVDEEPYNLATWLAIRAARQIGAATTFFTWQNLYRRYPLPFRWLEQANYRACSLVIAGNQDAAAVLQQKGYNGEIRVIPQFGVDPDIFAPPSVDSPDCVRSSLATSHQLPVTCHIGYAGGLLPEKGVDLLLRACAGLQGDWRLSLVGSGEAGPALRNLADTLGVTERVALGRRVVSHQMPDFYRSLDVLVLPSRTRPNWKEQFGRVLIEAMACGVPVIGSTCGEIPNVIGDAGLIFSEGDEAALRHQLQYLLDNWSERERLSAAGRARVLEHYTMQQIAIQTVECYRSLLAACETHNP